MADANKPFGQHVEEEPQKRPARKPAASVAVRRTAAARPTSSRSPAQAATGGVAEVVTNLQSYIKRLGKADLHRLIDTLCLRARQVLR